MHHLTNIKDIEQAIADINAGEYTQINGLVKNILLRLDTEETFYIKF